MKNEWNVINDNMGWCSVFINWFNSFHSQFFRGGPWLTVCICYLWFFSGIFITCTIFRKELSNAFLPFGGWPPLDRISSTVLVLASSWVVWWTNRWWWSTKLFTRSFGTNSWESKLHNVQQSEQWSVTKFWTGFQNDSSKGSLNLWSHGLKI